jgi:hypothetical protein
MSNSYVSEAEQTWIYLSDRAGIIATANFPLLWVFASRNDVFMWLTGWSFATFNVFHKWLARIVTIQAILHSVGYTVDAFIGALIRPRCSFFSSCLGQCSSSVARLRLHLHPAECLWAAC